jgi:pentatricopeptide repeat protein
VGAVLCSALINAYGKAGLLAKMDSTYVLMQVMGVAPNEHTFSALIDGYGKKGRVEKAEAALRDMLKAGFSMNLVAYTSIIDAYGSAKMFKVRWWEKKWSYYPSHSFLHACDLFFFVNYK